MKPDIERHKLFSRRAMIVGTGQFALMGALVARMYYLQVLERDKYQTLAEENRINLRLIQPARGRLVDRFGQVMASNRQSYRAVVIAEKAKGVERIVDTLASVITISERDRKKFMKEARRKRSFVPITVRDNLNWDEVSRIEVNTPDLPGVFVESGLTRFYPMGQGAAHVLGYVAAVSEAEQTGDPLLELPTFRIGKNGVEYSYDEVLRGKAGRSQVEVNAHGRIIKELSRVEPVPGTDLVLTLDAGLQAFVSDRLRDEPSAAAVVLDVHTGQVLALGSQPSFEPSKFHDGIDHKTWGLLNRSETKPLINKALNGEFAPGSTFKMCVALTALEAGLITPQTRFTCRGVKILGGARFHCWKRSGHGSVQLKWGIKQSCDVYFYEVARRCGVDRIAAMAHKLGLGAPAGIDIKGEKPGFIPTTAWKFATLGEKWQPGEDLVAGIGQGYITTTPLQLAVMTARIVNGGRAVVPHISRDELKPGGMTAREYETAEHLAISERSLKLVSDAMAGVVNEAGGTARRGRINEPGMSMGGKTGTAQVRRITAAERARGVKKNRDLPWKLRDHGLFVGFGPVDEPRYAVSVVLQHGSSSRYAVPVARDIMRETLWRDPLRLGPEDLLRKQTARENGEEG